MWPGWSNLERGVRLMLATGAGIRELFLRPQAQAAVLLFILAATGLPEALRLLARMVKGAE